MSRSIEHLVERVEQYRQCLVNDEGAVPVRLENRKARFTNIDRAALVNHLLWMCDRIMVSLDEGKTARAWRWLGFVEGSRYLLDIAVIDDMRDVVDEGVAAGEVVCAD